MVNKPFKDSHEFKYWLRAIFSDSYFLMSASFLIAVHILMSCGTADPEPRPDPLPVPEPSGPMFMSSILFDDSLKDAVGCMDVLIYGASDLKMLESHLRLEEWVSSCSVELLAGDKLVAILANSPSKLNLKAVERYDSLDQLMFDFRDFVPQRPIMSFLGTFAAGDDIAPDLSPLCASVAISRISNALPDYTLLENPRVGLCDLNPSASPFQKEDFFPSASIEQGQMTGLPHDIGFYSQYPDIRLWCLPNSTPENTFGSLHTSLLFECEIAGETCRFTEDLPALGRGETIEADITITEDARMIVNFSRALTS